MKLYCGSGDGTLCELETVKVIGEGSIVIRINMRCSDGAISKMERELSKKFGRKVILLDVTYGEILTLPPEKSPAAGSREP